MSAVLEYVFHATSDDTFVDHFVSYCSFALHITFFISPIPVFDDLGDSSFGTSFLSYSFAIWYAKVNGDFRNEIRFVIVFLGIIDHVFTVVLPLE